MKAIILSSLLVAIISGRQSLYGQCGGSGWVGAMECVSDACCQSNSPRYYQCTPGTCTGPTVMSATTITTMAATTSQITTPMITNTTAITSVPALGPPAPPAVPESNVAAYPFDMSTVTLSSSRWSENQGRTLTYLKYLSVDRLLYVFRSNHGISTNNASSNGGWDAPTFPFRSHFQGHILTAWAQCYASLRDSTCKSMATSFVLGLLACQNNNAAKGYGTGYLSGFPETEFTALEGGTLTNGNVPYYAIHKTMAGLLDVWRNINDGNSKVVLLALANWVNTRTAGFSTSQMQTILGTEHGGMVEVLTDLYFQTGNSTWLTVAKRFEHSSVITPLASNTDNLNGLHANTNLPKFIGAAREYKANGNNTNRVIAVNAWNIISSAHTYAQGGTSQAEHWHAANAVAAYLTSDTAESCDTYNLLKLTREVWTISPSVAAADFYESSVMNMMLGQQNPSDSHGHITYFNSMNPGGYRGLGPAWGGGTWSTDYDSFWCCQGTGLETQTKFMDSIYFYDNSSLYVNLFTPSTLSWSAKNMVITQSTSYPTTTTSTITISAGSASFSMKIRIPSWTSGASITVNGLPAGVTVSAGSYSIITRIWSAGDIVVITLPMKFRKIVANDNSAMAAVAYGPMVLVGNYGNTNLSSAPNINLGTLWRTSSSALTFTATANNATVMLVPWFNGQGFNYVTYWVTSGSVPI